MKILCKVFVLLLLLSVSPNDRFVFGRPEDVEGRWCFAPKGYYNTESKKKDTKISRRIEKTKNQIKEWMDSTAGPFFQNLLERGSPPTVKQSAAMVKKASLAQEAQLKSSQAEQLRKTMRDLTYRKRQKVLIDEDGTKLTSGEARRIVTLFQARKNVGLKKDIDKLHLEELHYRNSTKTEQTAVKNARMAEVRINQAIMTEKMARERLAQAKEELADAQQSEIDALNAESNAITRANNDWKALDDVRERVRSALLREQEVFLVKETRQLKQELKRLETSSSKVRDEERRATRDLKEANKDAQKY